MNISQKYELRMLSDDNQVDMERIAELFSVHLRTVRYDIEILNTYLTQELGTACIVVSNKMAYVEETFQYLQHHSRAGGQIFREQSYCK